MLMTQLVSCTGVSFERRESAPITVPKFMGRANVQLQIMSWSTLEFKNERRVCAAAVFEHIQKHDYMDLWTIFTTTCDPFGHHNFTAPLGQQQDSVTGAAARHPLHDEGRSVRNHDRQRADLPHSRLQDHRAARLPRAQGPLTHAVPQGRARAPGRVRPRG